MEAVCSVPETSQPRPSILSRSRRRPTRRTSIKIADRAVIESLVADDFHFTSPLDNRIDRGTYFARCWPNSEDITAFTFIHCVQDGDRVFVTYEGRGPGGKGFRNTEILTIRDGKLVEAEVYFGWSLPHEAPAGGFTNPNT
jgi:ketosteroid isomerase-like protein